MSVSYVRPLTKAGHLWVILGRPLESWLHQSTLHLMMSCPSEARPQPLLFP